MIFCDGDEVRVNLEIEKYRFGTFSGTEGGENIPNFKKFFKKTIGTIIEYDYSSKMKENTYLVQFGDDVLKSYWFIGSELILVS